MYVCNGVPLYTVDYQQAEIGNCCLSARIVLCMFSNIKVLVWSPSLNSPYVLLVPLTK